MSLYIIQVPTSALNNKIPPTEHSIIAYVVNPSTKGAGTKNIATINLKTLSALFWFVLNNSIVEY